MVRSVSEDQLYDTIEFNEFLQMMSKQQEDELNMDTLMEAFKYWILEKKRWTEKFHLIPF